MLGRSISYVSFSENWSVNGINQSVAKGAPAQGSSLKSKNDTTVPLVGDHSGEKLTADKSVKTREATKCDTSCSLSDKTEKIKECMRRLLAQKFPNVEGRRGTDKVVFNTGCECLDNALFIVENHPSVFIKVAWMADIAEFVGRHMGLAGLNKDKKERIRLLLERVQQQMQSLLQTMEAELARAESVSEKSTILPHPLTPRGKSFSNLSIFLCDLPSDVSAYASQSKTAWYAKQYYEALSQSKFQGVEPPDALIHTHASRVALMAICHISSKFDRLFNSDVIAKKAKEWLGELDQYGDINSQSFYKHLQTIALYAESAVATMDLTVADASVIYYRLARTFCRLATLDPPKAVPWMFEKDVVLFGELKEDRERYDTQKKKQKTRIKQACQYLDEVRELGIDKQRQAELHFYYVYMVEMGNIQELLPEALSRMRQGACLGRAGMHHLYLLNCLNHATFLYPKNYGKPFREWLRIQCEPDTLQQGLPQYSHDYCSPLMRGMVHFLVFDEKGLEEGMKSDLFEVNDEDKRLAYTLKKIALKKYAEAYHDLEFEQGMHQNSDDTVDFLAGYCCEQMIETDKSFLHQALKNYECAFDGEDGAKCTGLDYGRLVAKHMEELDEGLLLKAEGFLESAAEYFRQNELLDEFEECHHYLEFLGDRNSKAGLNQSSPSGEFSCRDGADKVKPRVVRSKRKTQKKLKKPNQRKPQRVTPDFIKGLSSEPADRSFGRSHECPSPSSGSHNFYSDEVSSESAESETEPVTESVSSDVVSSDNQQANIYEAIHMLNRAHYLISTYDFMGAELQLEKVSHCHDRRLKGRIAHMKCWCLRQRFQHNVPGAHVQETIKETMIALLTQAEREAINGLRSMGIKGDVAKCSYQSVTGISFNDGEVRTLASLFAELGHIYRNLSGFQKKSANSRRLGESMSNLADHLNPTRRARSSAVSVEHEPRVKVISRKEIEGMKKSLGSQNA